jgi:hypothetical protein
MVSSSRVYSKCLKWVFLMPSLREISSTRYPLLYPGYLIYYSCTCHTKFNTSNTQFSVRWPYLSTLPGGTVEQQQHLACPLLMPWAPCRPAAEADEPDYSRVPGYTRVQGTSMYTIVHLYPGSILDLQLCTKKSTGSTAVPLEKYSCGTRVPLQVLQYTAVLVYSIYIGY